MDYVYIKLRFSSPIPLGAKVKRNGPPGATTAQPHFGELTKDIVPVGVWSFSGKVVSALIPLIHC